ncbi:MAG: LacI family DNA-binding transcriptional regulator [Candidatus Alectryocaccobium sp.]
MPTIKDIAKAAHVSTGTVSNVLNNKGNVSTEKINLVEEAIQKMGYSINESARTLRLKNKKVIFLIVPDMRSRHYISFYNNILNSTRSRGYTVEIYGTHNLYRNEKELVQKAISDNVSYIIAFPTYINSSIYNVIPLSINVILVGPRPKGITRDFLTVSFDYEQVAENISSYIIYKHYKKVALFVDSVRFSEEFVLVLLQNLRRKNISVTTYGSTPHNAIVKAFEFYDPSKRIDAFITTNIIRANAIQLVHEYISTTGVKPEIITLSSINNLLENNFTSVFLNYPKLGNMVAERILAQTTNISFDNSSIILSTESLIKKEVAIKKSPTPSTLNIYGPNNKCFQLLQKLLPRFENASGISVKLYLHNLSDTESVPKTLQENADILIANQNSLAITNKSPFLTKENNESLWADLNGYVNPNEVFFPSVSKDHCCFSFNASGYFLFYRTDLFQKHDCQREFYETENHPLEVPKTIKEYDELFYHFTRSINPLSKTIYGGSLSSLYNEHALYELASYLCYNLNLIRKDHIKINYSTKSVNETIRQYLEHLRISNAAVTKNTVSACESYINSDSLMSLLSSSNAPLFNENTSHTISNCTKTTLLSPGAPLINYDIIGITKSCRHKDSGLQFMKWILQDSITEMLTFISGQPIKKNAIKNSDILSQYPWLRHFDELINNGLLLTDIFPPYIFRSNLANMLLDTLSAAYFNLNELPVLLSNFQNKLSEAKYILTP